MLADSDGASAVDDDDEAIHVGGRQLGFPPLRCDLHVSVDQSIFSKQYSVSLSRLPLGISGQPHVYMPFTLLGSLQYRSFVQEAELTITFAYASGNFVMQTSHSHSRGIFAKVFHASPSPARDGGEHGTTVSAPVV